MDAADSAVRRELERRLAVIGTEAEEPHRAPLPRADLTAVVLIVVLSVLVGLVAGTL